MRIAIGGIVHETNTMFGPPTPVEEFQRQHWEAGEEIRQLHTGVRSPFGGMLDAAAELGVELLSLIHISMCIRDRGGAGPPARRAGRVISRAG